MMGNSTRNYIGILSLLLAIILNSYTEAAFSSPVIIQAFTNRSHVSKPSFDNYKAERLLVIETEKSRALGSKVNLNSREQLANVIFQKVKNRDMQEGFHNPGDFSGAVHIFRALQDIENSEMFHLIRRMPKGGVLHAHDTALASTDYVMTVTYWDNLWQCRVPDTTDLSLIFSRGPPTSLNDCKWILVADERARVGADKYDEELRKHFSLYVDDPETAYHDINDVWDAFGAIFGKITPMLTYVPVWKAYYKQALKEFYDDGVQYLEFRGTLPDLYDLDGNIYRNGQVLQIYITALEEFKAENPGFIDSKFIFAPVRFVDDETFLAYKAAMIDFKFNFPSFVVGFDLVAQEDAGRPLIDFAEQLLDFPDNINFYFHSGETNWNGMGPDENLIDAVLLGAKRIGHGYAILKHPSVMSMVKQRDIAIEINPISNQVLKLLSDHRNHPAAHLFADDYPLVISSDDPSFWETTPLSHDFYIAFMGMASAHSDLRTLKQLALNSLKYSSLSAIEKISALNKWQRQWDEYIEWVIFRGKKYIS